MRYLPTLRPKGSIPGFIPTLISCWSKWGTGSTAKANALRRSRRAGPVRYGHYTLYRGAYRREQRVAHGGHALWDGGYVVCGATGSGEMFVLRDPWGIRPAFWYKDDEVLVVASERPVIQTVFALETEQIHELMPGQAVSVHKDGEMRLEQILQPKEVKACSFERIYFSRGSDRDIYLERKGFGHAVARCHPESHWRGFGTYGVLFYSEHGGSRLLWHVGRFQGISEPNQDCPDRSVGA